MFSENNQRVLIWVLIGILIFHLISKKCTKEHFNNYHQFMWGVPNPYPMVNPKNNLHWKYCGGNKWSNYKCNLWDPLCIERMGRGPPVIPPPNNSMIFS